MTDREVMQQALEALEGVVRAHSYESGTPVDAITALRARLAEPEPEPVAWMDVDDQGNRLSLRFWSDGNKEEVPLYTHTPPADPDTITVRLTREQHWRMRSLVKAGQWVSPLCLSELEDLLAALGTFDKEGA